MSGIIKVCLLLAVVVCLSTAQTDGSGKQCLCQRVRKGINSRAEVKDIQIYPATIFCDKVEIVVTNNSGLRYCLNPEMAPVRRLLANIMGKKKTSTTSRPNVFTSTPGSTNTARI